MMKRKGGERSLTGGECVAKWQGYKQTTRSGQQGRRIRRDSIIIWAVQDVDDGLTFERSWSTLTTIHRFVIVI
jgi:hypothetical protein